MGNGSFTYRLEGIDKEKCKVPPDGTITYSRLPAGKYAFVTDNLSWKFRVRHPFYASVTAWCLYVLLLGGIIRIVVMIMHRRNAAAMKKLMEKQELEIVKLENEKLQSEISYKGKELSDFSMNLIRKGEMMQALLKELDSQKEALGQSYPNKYYNRMRALIEDNFSSDEEWEVFRKNFDLIHDNFFRILNEKYPDLSSSDLKLCALLRLNLDTKEIARMLNITVRGVETRRYRLRRKLGLSQEESLSKFLISVK